MSASASKENLELKSIGTAQPQITTNSITGPSTEGKVARRSSVTRKRVPPLPPTHADVSSSPPKSNVANETEANSPVPPAASLMKVFDQFPVEGEGITTQREMVDNSFAQDCSTSPAGAKKDTSDNALERELREMKKDIDSFEPTKSGYN